MNQKPTCFGCKKEQKLGLDTTISGNVYPIFGGTTFESSGSYGCTVFDPMGEFNRLLQVFICNDCLTKHCSDIYQLDFEGKERRDDNCKRSVFRDVLVDFREDWKAYDGKEKHKLETRQRILDQFKDI